MICDTPNPEECLWFTIERVHVDDMVGLKRFAMVIAAPPLAGPARVLQVMDTHARFQTGLIQMRGDLHSFYRAETGVRVEERLGFCAYCRRGDIVQRTFSRETCQAIPMPYDFQTDDKPATCQPTVCAV